MSLYELRSQRQPNSRDKSSAVIVLAALTKSARFAGYGIPAFHACKVQCSKFLKNSHKSLEMRLQSGQILKYGFGFRIYPTCAGGFKGDCCDGDKRPTYAVALVVDPRPHQIKRAQLRQRNPKAVPCDGDALDLLPIEPQQPAHCHLDLTLQSAEHAVSEGLFELLMC